MATRPIGPTTWVGSDGSARIRVAIESVSNSEGGADTKTFDELSITYACFHEETKNLASGANTITIPPVDATVQYKATALLLLPPAGNTTLITLKGVTGDTGVPLCKTGWSLITFDTTATTICLTAASALTGVKLFWR
jgi:hypothetical protein